MHRPVVRLPHILLASALALSAIAVAAPRDAATGQAAGKRMYKPYTAQSAGCAATNVQPVKVASDPEEGGQVARTTTPKAKFDEFKVTKSTDVASPKILDSAPPDSAPCASVQH